MRLMDNIPVYWKHAAAEQHARHYSTDFIRLETQEILWYSKSKNRPSGLRTIRARLSKEFDKWYEENGLGSVAIYISCFDLSPRKNKMAKPFYLALIGNKEEVEKVKFLISLKYA